MVQWNGFWVCSYCPFHLDDIHNDIYSCYIYDGRWLVKNRSTKIIKIKEMNVIDLVRLAKKRKETRMREIANWYNTSNSSCTRIRGAGNGL